jgi:hypothetical protein
MPGRLGLNRPYHQEKHQGPWNPPTRRNSRAAKHGRTLKQPPVTASDQQAKATKGRD